MSSTRVLALTAGGAIAIGASVLIPGGAATGETPSASCGSAHWPATVSGAPASSSAPYRLWRTSSGWHLRIAGASGTSYAARVSADRRIRLVHRTLPASALQRGTKTITISATGRGHVAGIDFSVGCARRLHLGFADPGASSPGATAGSSSTSGAATGSTGADTSPSGTIDSSGPSGTSSGTTTTDTTSSNGTAVPPPRPTHSPPATAAAAPVPGGTDSAATDTVALGRHGFAPAAAFDVLRPGDTGIAGQVIRGRACPVVGPQSCGQATGTPGTVKIETAPSSRDQTPQFVRRVSTAADGSFAASLPPGAYQVTGEAPGQQDSSARVVVIDAGVVSDAILPVGTRMY